MITKHKSSAGNFVTTLMIVLVGCSGQVAQASIVFQEGFESGLNATVWDWNRDNWRGTKQLVTSNPHGGSQALYMSGSDSAPGGCSFMQPRQSFSVASAVLKLWYRDMTLTRPGGGGGGIFRFRF